MYIPAADETDICNGVNIPFVLGIFPICRYLFYYARALALNYFLSASVQHFTGTKGDMSMIEMITSINGKINGFVWGIPMLVLLVGTGILMTMLTKVFQISHFGYWMKHTLGSIFTDKHITKHTDENDQSISQFQSLCTALAATIGTGNIVALPLHCCSAVQAPSSGCGSWHFLA